MRKVMGQGRTLRANSHKAPAQSAFKRLLRPWMLLLATLLLAACVPSLPRGNSSDLNTLTELAQRVQSANIPNPSGDSVGSYLLAESAQTERWHAQRGAALDSIRRELSRFGNDPGESSTTPSNALGAWRYDEGPNGPFITHQRTRRVFSLVEDPAAQSVEAIRISNGGNRLALLVQQGNDRSKLQVIDGITGQRWGTGPVPGYDVVWGNSEQRLFLTTLVAGEPRELIQIDLANDTPVTTTLYSEPHQGGVSLLLHRGKAQSPILATRSSPTGTGLLAIDDRGETTHVRKLVELVPGRWLHLKNDSATPRVAIRDGRADVLYRLTPTFQLEEDFAQLRAHGSLENHWQLGQATFLFIRRRTGTSIVRLGNHGEFEVVCESLSHLTFPTQSIDEPSYIRFRTGIVEPGPTFVIDSNTETCPVESNEDTGKEQLHFIAARDGTDIPVLIIGNSQMLQPTFVSLYGSYGMVPWPEQTPFLRALLARGFRIVVPFVRGTGFWGPPWHAAALGARKELSFTDAIDVLQALISPGAPLIIRGRSAGATLAIVASSQLVAAPRGLILEYPLLDIELATMGASAPLQRRELLEWGNFSSDWSRISPAHRAPLRSDTMISIRFGIDDPLIPLGSVVRWIARQRAASDPDRLLLTRVDRTYGHGERADEQTAWAESLLFIDTVL